MGALGEFRRSRFFKPLNDEQKAAADSDRPLIVVSAGAGTGKTKTLVARYLRLLLERVEREGVQRDSLDHLLAITYTRQAAEEMRQRIEEALRELGLTVLARMIDRAWISTIHSFCERVLRRYAIDLGIDPYFTGLDEDQSTLLRLQSFDEAFPAFFQQAPDAFLRLSACFSRKQLSDASASIISQVALTGTPVTDLRPDSFTPAHQQLGCPDDATLRALLDFTALRQGLYTKLKEQQGAFDFSDLLLYGRAALGVSHLRDRFTGQFTEVMLDESQDTNMLQLGIVEQFARRRFIVGDFKQSIFGFQGADASVFSDLSTRAQDPADRDCLPVSLVQNYRSREAILTKVNELFGPERLAVGDFEKLKAGEDWQRATGEAGATAPDPVVIEGLRRSDDTSIAAAEGEWIAAQVAALIGRPRRDTEDPDAVFRPGDIVVLVAKRAYGTAITAALTQRGIAARIIGADDFFSLPVIESARIFLKALRNPCDDETFTRLMISELGRVSDQEIFELACRAHEQNSALWTAAQQRKTGEVVRIRTLLQRAFEALGALPFSELLFQVFEDESISAQDRASLRHLGSIADELQAGGGALVDLIAWIDDRKNNKAKVEALMPADDEHATVRIMTIHASKGLQFPAVAVATAQDAQNPRRPAQAPFVIDRTLGFKYQKGETCTTPAAEAAIESGKERERAEKVRQLYVACTRAEQVLLLSYDADARGGITADLARAIREGECAHD